MAQDLNVRLHAIRSIWLERCWDTYKRSKETPGMRLQ